MENLKNTVGLSAKSGRQASCDGTAQNLFEKTRRRAEMYLYGWVLTVAAGLLLVMFISHRIYPFGDKVLQYADGDQNLGFTGYLQSTFFTNNDILYSWSSVLGGNALGSMAFYAGSIFNLLTVLFPGNLMLAYHIILVLKFLAAALCFAVLLVRIFPEADKKATVLFSASYPFIGYMTYFIWQQSWLDGVIFLPLIALGIWQIINKKKVLLYVLSLATACLSNFYVGYMLFVASVLLFIAGLFLALPKWSSDVLRTTGRYIAATALAVGLAAIVLVPVFFSLPEGRKAALQDIFAGVNYICGPAEVLSMLYTAPLQNMKYQDNYPIIYTGIVQLVLVIIFFLNRKIPSKIKAVASVLLSILALSFMVSLPNLIWHGFSENIWYNFRYSYVVSFILEILAFYALTHLQGSKETLPAAGAVAAALSAFALRTDKGNIGAGTFLLDAACIVATLLLLSLYARQTKAAASGNPFITFLLIAALTLVPISCNTYRSTEGRGELNEADDGLGNLGSYTEAVDRERLITDLIDDGGFYRRASTERYGRTDSALFGYPGVSSYSSAEDVGTLAAVSRLGFWYVGHEAEYEANVPIATDALLGIKYIVLNNSFKADWLPEKGPVPDSDLTVLENPYALPILFPAGTTFDEQGAKLNTMDLLNSFWNSICPDGGDVFEILSTTIETVPAQEGTDLIIHFRTKTEGPVYAYVPQGDYSANFPLPSRRQDTYWLGNFEAGQESELTLHTRDSYTGSDNIAVGTERIDVLAEKAAFVQSCSTEVQMESSSCLQLLFRTEDDVTMASTIPFDEGWHVFIDGNETETFRNMNWFLAFDVPAGQHALKLQYRPPHLETGAVISAAALAVLLLYIFRSRAAKRLSGNSPGHHHTPPQAADSSSAAAPNYRSSTKPWKN